MWLTLGRSVEGRAIEVYLRKAVGRPSVLVLGGFHGDEPKGVSVARRLVDLVESQEKNPQVRWSIVPLVNPDGYQRRKRRYAHSFDINRNFPTKNWRCTSRRSRMFGGHEPASEPETRAVIEVVRRCTPSVIVTIHSIGNDRFCNNYDGPGRKLARAMHASNGYPVSDSIGYPTPGSFGTWAGRELNIPVVTLELPSHHSPKRCWEDNRGALMALAGAVR